MTSRTNFGAALDTVASVHAQLAVKDEYTFACCLSESLTYSLPDKCRKGEPAPPVMERERTAPESVQPRSYSDKSPKRSAFSTMLEAAKASSLPERGVRTVSDGIVQ
jgi:hypothetical protein